MKVRLSSTGNGTAVLPGFDAESANRFELELTPDGLLVVDTSVGDDAVSDIAVARVWLDGSGSTTHRVIGWQFGFRAFIIPPEGCN